MTTAGRCTRVSLSTDEGSGRLSSTNGFFPFPDYSQSGLDMISNKGTPVCVHLHDGLAVHDGLTVHTTLFWIS